MRTVLLLITLLLIGHLHAESQQQEQGPLETDIYEKRINEIFASSDSEIIDTDLKGHLELGNAYRFYYQRGVIFLEQEGGESRTYGDFSKSKLSYYSPPEQKVLGLENMPNQDRTAIAIKLKELLLESLLSENLDPSEFGPMSDDKGEPWDPNRDAFLFRFSYEKDNDSDISGKGSVFFHISLETRAVNALWYEHHFSDIHVSENLGYKSFRETKEPKAVEYMMSREMREKFRKVIKELEADD